MLKALISTLHSGTEIAFLLALLSAYLLNSGRIRLVSRLKWGAVFGLAVSLALTYGTTAIWERETVELVVNGLATVFTLGIITWIGWANRAAYERTGGKVRQVIPILIFLAAVILVTLPGLDIGLTQTKIFLGLDRPTSTEVAGKLGALLLVLVVTALAGIALHKVAAQSRLGLVRPIIMIVLCVILIRDTTTVLQVMLVKGMIPLSDWLFRIMVTLVNNNVIFFYLLLAAAVSLVSTAFWKWRRQKYSFDGLNPAQKRKLRVVAQRTAKLFGASGLLLLLVILGEGTGSVFANRPPQLSPATPVSAENGRVRIPVGTVADGQLHRFSFAVEDTVVRFLVVYKGSGIYGVVLDACTFCGATGYHQEKDNIICNKCNAAINKNTIGFLGGCNPVPLRYEKEGESVGIAVDELEAAKWFFAR